MLTNEQIDALDNRQLNKLGRERGLKIKSLSPFQIREWLKANPMTNTTEVTKMTTKTKTAKKAKAAPKAKKDRKVREGTKSAKAMEIYSANKKLPRRDVIAMFMKIGLSKADASTYYQNCKNKSK